MSPADCCVTSFGEMSYGDLKLDQIKGISYPLDVFLGPRHPFMKGIDNCFSGSFFCSIAFSYAFSSRITLPDIGIMAPLRNIHKNSDF